MLNKGDEVIIVGPPDGPGDYLYEGIKYSFSDEMCAYIGNNAFVKCRDYGRPESWRLDEPSCYYWHESWLKPVKEYKPIEDNEMMTMFQ